MFSGVSLNVDGRGRVGSQSAIEGTHKPNEYVKWIKFGFYDINSGSETPVRIRENARNSNNIYISKNKRELVILIRIRFYSFRIFSRRRRTTAIRIIFESNCSLKFPRKLRRKKMGIGIDRRFSGPNEKQKVKAFQLCNERANPFKFVPCAMCCWSVCVGNAAKRK